VLERRGVLTVEGVRDDQEGGCAHCQPAGNGSSDAADGDKLKEAIDNLTTSVGTVIGNGLLTSIDALARVNPEIAPVLVLPARYPAGGDSARLYAPGRRLLKT
jgi:hypothetical protein